VYVTPLTSRCQFLTVQAVAWKVFIVQRKGRDRYVVGAVVGGRGQLQPRGGHDLHADLRIVDGRPIVVGIRVNRRPEGKDQRPLSLRELRRLPLATFMEAAREGVAANLAGASGHEFGRRVTRARVPRTKSGRKTETDWQRLAAAILDERGRGTLNPGAAVARRMGVDPGTMRVWVHRMRQRGLLPPPEGGL
jgi:hypothetical protein